MSELNIFDTSELIDWCDRCGAPTDIIVIHERDDTDLALCRAHYRIFKAKLSEQGFYVVWDSDE